MLNYKHVKSGKLYRYIGVGKLEATGEPVVIYQAVKGGQIWVRPSDEFYDGRFKEVSQ